jgi:hypothetical protein
MQAARLGALHRPHSWIPFPARCAAGDDTDGVIYAFTPSFFCRLDDDVVYWKSSFFSG